jgi:CMP-N-acetylneuraminic acid synthetase
MKLGIIPARGGSKGVPRKNIRMIAGKPLIAWTIDAARRSLLLDRWIVSTEDEEIAKVSEKHGAEVLLRPIELAGDAVSTLAVLKHVVDQIPCETVVLLQATSPIRHEGLIDECIQEFVSGGYDSLATGFMCHYIEYGRDVLLSKDGTELRRQDVEGFFYDDGNVYVIRADCIRQGDRYGRKICRRTISRWENVEIDDDFDFWVTEKILQKGYTI